MDFDGTSTWGTITGMNSLSTYECTIHAVTVLDGPTSYSVTVTTHTGMFVCTQISLVCSYVYMYIRYIRKSQF